MSATDPTILIFQRILARTAQALARTGFEAEAHEAFRQGLETGCRLAGGAPGRLRQAESGAPKEKTS